MAVMAEPEVMALHPGLARNTEMVVLVALVEVHLFGQMLQVTLVLVLVVLMEMLEQVTEHLTALSQEVVDKEPRQEHLENKMGSCLLEVAVVRMETHPTVKIGMVVLEAVELVAEPMIRVKLLPEQKTQAAAVAECFRILAIFFDIRVLVAPVLSSSALHKEVQLCTH